METKNKEFDNLITEVNDYLDTRSRLGKLKAIDKGSQIASGATAVLFVLLITFLAILFLSLAIAVIVAEATGIAYAGYLSVAGFYFLLGILIYVNRESWIRKPMVNAMIRNFLKDPENEN